MDIPSFDRVLKHDLTTGQSWEFRLGEGRACGDIVFVPADGEGASSSSSSSSSSDQKQDDAQREEDGYLLVMVHVLDEDQPRTELVVLGNDTSGGVVGGGGGGGGGGGSGGLEKVATVHIPIRVPFGFHNEWVPGGALHGWSA